MELKNPQLAHILALAPKLKPDVGGHVVEPNGDAPVLDPNKLEVVSGVPKPPDVGGHVVEPNGEAPVL